MRYAVVVAGILSCAPSQVMGALSLEVIARSGAAGSLGPNVEADTVFSSFFGPVVDASGRIVFYAEVFGPNVPAGGEFGVWAHDAGTNDLRIRTSDLSPFTGAPIGFLNSNANTGDGDVAVTSFDETFVHAGGVLSTLTHTTMQPPSTGPGVFFGPPELVLTNGVGTYAFRNNLTGAVSATDFTTVYAGTPGALTLVARTGNGAPGFTGLTLASIGSVRMARDGGLAIDGFLDGPGVDGTNNTAIWSGAPGALTPVARTGDAAPGMPAGAVFSEFTPGGYSVGDSAGTVVFKARVAGGGVTTADDEGVWVGAPGGLTLALREGDQAPGLPAGVLMDSLQFIFTNPSIDSAGRITTRIALTGAGVDSTNNEAVMHGAVGSIQPVLRKGDAAPEAPGFSVAFFSQVATNDSGQVLLDASIDDGSTFTQGIYVWDATSGLTLVARAGEPYDLGAGEVGTLANLQFSAAEFDGAGVASGIGDDGTIVIRGQVQPFGNMLFRAQAPGAGNPFDLTGDGVVDGADLGLLLGAWGPCAGCPADLNGDGVVDGADLGLLLGAWGS
ncbi:MAG: choice-of-anchor tandem repeat NxxGxxAF-containing protein [Phycisphaerales bacterium]